MTAAACAAGAARPPGCPHSNRHALLQPRHLAWMPSLDPSPKYQTPEMQARVLTEPLGNPASARVQDMAALFTVC
jgi:hypothetical protein